MQRLTEVTAENTAAPALMQGHTNEDSDMMHRMQAILQARRAARNGNGRQNEHEHGVLARWTPRRQVLQELHARNINSTQQLHADNINLDYEFDDLPDLRSSTDSSREDNDFDEDQSGSAEDDLPGLMNKPEDDIVINDNEGEYVSPAIVADTDEEDPADWSEDTDDDSLPDLVPIDSHTEDADSEDIDSSLVAEFMGFVIDGADYQVLPMPRFRLVDEVDELDHVD